MQDESYCCGCPMVHLCLLSVCARPLSLPAPSLHSPTRIPRQVSEALRLLQQHLLTQQLQLPVEGARAEEGQQVSCDSRRGAASPEPAETGAVVLGAR